ncbi:hypothetical protein NUW58_g7514 [Xylaria curta]|uniref:Uncharacterized protein n=1 Tax=Xylaria curta TaxID=42375 RepID=A0ACC1NHJ7_9PEZI|nr:hypothetical protein NUW58_g7514 [Xylaria curta]
MAVSKDNQAAAAKKPTEKKGRKVSKTPNPNQKRGQPTAAARLISSPFIKFGWHKPLGGAVKETVQHLSSMADSMYMLQIDRERPIEALSLRNAMFWEHRQLDDELIVSTPAIDHIDLFPEDDASFQETIGKIGKKQYDRMFLLHYLFDKMRFREFLLLPIELDGVWVTIVTRTGQKSQLLREVTDFAIVDPLPNGRESRRSLVHRRLRAILAEGFIELPERVTVRDITIPDIEDGESDNHWKTGLIAYAFAREFLRRLKTLQFRRAQNSHRNSEHCDEFLWAAFEEHYNFDAFRQTLMSACAHQTIESSGLIVCDISVLIQTAMRNGRSSSRRLTQSRLM